MQIRKNVKRMIKSQLQSYELNPQLYYKEIVALKADIENSTRKEPVAKIQYSRDDY